MPITRQPYFLPTQITGCSLWLDGLDSSTVSFSSGSNVSSWSDKSGNGRNATVYAGTPTYTSALGMTFNGSSSLQITYTASPTIESMFVIIKFNSVSGQGDILSGTAAGQREYLMYFPYSPGTIYLGRHSTAPSGAINGGTVTTGSNYLLGYVFNGTGNTISFFQSGNTITSGTPQFTYSAGGTISVIGSYNGGGYLQGQIYEMIIYSTALNTTERQQVEGYLAQKWGLTGSLPTGHPGLNKIIHRNLQTTFSKTPYFVRFSPKQIAGCSHWFDATDSSTITLSSGSLTQWNDKSGNGRNLTAVSGFANATVSSAYQNGLNVFNFSGNGLYRTAAGNVSYPLDVFIIVALKSLTTHVDVLGMGDTSVDNFNSLTFAESAASRWHNGSSGGGRQTISTSDETSLSFLLIQWSIANGNYLLRRNGTQLIQASRTYSFNNSATSIFQIGYRHTDTIYGTNANFRGYIGEIVVFNNQIGTTDRQNVESYLAQKWGLVSSLPAGHLNATFPAGSPTVLQAFVPSIRPAVSSIPFIGGGSASSSGVFSIRTFLTTGQLILSKRISATILVVGGGGGGGSAGVQTGGGGAGGAVFVSSPVTITAGIYTVTVGTGGGINTNGTNSTFISYTGVGGGGGGNWVNGAGKTGGCGGGGSGEGGSGAAGSQGFGGASGRGQFTCGGGGGGMGQAGKQPADGSPSSGGNGLQYSITGSSVYYAGGGAGGFNGASTGGLGGGGDKTLQGTDGLGGGGGSGARGGNGVVILSFVFL